jgi:phage portal protein BeeE
VLTEGGRRASSPSAPIDMELLASRRFEREDICQACGVPPVLIGENEKTSSWGTGIEQITLGFVKYT